MLPNPVAKYLAAVVALPEPSITIMLQTNPAGIYEVQWIQQATETLDQEWRYG